MLQLHRQLAETFLDNFPHQSNADQHKVVRNTDEEHPNNFQQEDQTKQSHVIEPLSKSPENKTGYHTTDAEKTQEKAGSYWWHFIREPRR